MKSVEGSNEGGIDKVLIHNFFGDSMAEERQYAHVEEMIKTFMNPIEENEEAEEAESDEKSKLDDSFVKEKEVRLNFDFEDDDLELNDSPLPKIWVI